MGYIITCYTLFDITSTGVINRGKPVDQDMEEWIYKRNTQCNFDTVLQAISLRSQPEIHRLPKLRKIRFDTFDKFGFLFEQKGSEEYNSWSFDFTVQHPSVFNDGISELGALYSDCNNVPMIKCGTEWDKLDQFLNTSEELRNIYFEIANNG